MVDIALITTLNEALKPSQYRDLVKGWDKERYKDIFTNPKYKHDRNGYRVFIPISDENIEGDQEKIIDSDFLVNKAQDNPTLKKRYKTAITVNDIIDYMKYKIVDYRKGIAKETEGKRQMKIGKILNQFKKTNKYPEAVVDNIMQQFANDPNRKSVRNEHFAVISRHPYDIAGMSTDRGWTSCMNLESGQYNHYVPLDIKHGSVIAYAVKSNDKNIENPVARVMIKPFLEIDKKDKDSEVVFGMEDRVYGEEPAGFVNVVKNWVDEINNAKDLDDVVKLRIHNELYADSKSTDIFIRKGKELSEENLIKLVKFDYRNIEKMNNPSEKVQLAAVESNARAFEYIKNPTDKVIETVLEINGAMIKYIKNPSPELQKIAVIGNPFAIRHISNPTEEAQILAVSETRDEKYSMDGYIQGDPHLIKDIANPTDAAIIAALESREAFSIFKWLIEKRNPTRAMKIAALNHSGAIISYIRNPDSNLQKLAVITTPIAIKLIDNPSEEIQLIAIRENPVVIREIEDPTPKAQLLAVQKNWQTIYMIQQPHEKTMLNVFEKEPKAFLHGQLAHKMTDKVAMKVIKEVPYVIKYMDQEKITDEMKLLAVKTYGSTIGYIENPSEELQIIAVKEDPYAIQEIENPSELVQITAVNTRADAIYNIDNPSERVQMAALKKDHESAFKYIRNPSKKVEEYFWKMRRGADGR